MVFCISVLSLSLYISVMLLSHCRALHVGPLLTAGHGELAAETPPFYYDWAAQLSRLSPNSRAAALGALEEEDRLVVQRIMDEATLGDSYMESPQYEGYAKPLQRAGSTGGSRPAVMRPRPANEGGAVVAEAREGSAHSTHSRAGSVTGGARSQQSSFTGPTAGGAPPSYEDVYPIPQPEQPPRPPPARSSPPRQPARPPTAAPPPADDLLGVGTSGSTGQQGRTLAAAPAAAVPAEDDLLGFSSTPTAQPAAAVERSAGSAAHIEELFTVPRPSPGSVTAAAAAPGPTAAAVPAAKPGAAAAPSSGTQAASSKSALDSMIDLGGALPADTAGFDELYSDADVGAAMAGGGPSLRGAG